MGWDVVNFDTVNSTQDKVAELICKGTYRDKTFVVAESQERGRGRCNTTWRSVAGCLTFSYATVEPQAMLAILANIQRTLGVFGVCAELKWPNDVLVCGRKVCGAIVDQHGTYNIVGIGINLSGDFEYATVEVLAGRNIAKSDFLAVYSTFCDSQESVDVHMHDLWLGDEIYTVKSVMDEHLVLADRHGREIHISAHEYSYKKELNRIVRK
jgi:BirA family biotin operon repressor/biotin-[acetyl-CoA-carboxylase] ligase